MAILTEPVTGVVNSTESELDQPGLVRSVFHSIELTSRINFSCVGGNRNRVFELKKSPKLAQSPETIKTRRSGLSSIFDIATSLSESLPKCGSVLIIGRVYLYFIFI